MGLAFKRATLIVNPAAGRGRGKRLAPLLEALARQHLSAAGSDCMLTTALTEPGRDAERMAAVAFQAGADLVIVAGGDGSLYGAVNALTGTPVTVSQIPIGTGNDFARALGIPREPAAAVALLTSGRVARVDVGVCGGRRFINVAGCGFDAAVAERINNRRRLLSGTAAYIWAVLTTLMTYRPSFMSISVDGEQLETRAMLCAVANGASYGGGMRVAPDARWDDGLLDVCVVRAVGKAEFLRAFPRVFRGKHTTHPAVVMMRGARVTVDSSPPVPLLLDGELVCTTPAAFSVEPAALRFVVP